MDKKLPGVFVNKIGKKISNNKTVYYGTHEKEVEEVKKEEKISSNRSIEKKFGKMELNIRQKISEVFKSVNYIYKMDVSLTLKDGKQTKRIIGYNENDLITYDNELIPISDVLDIEVIEKE